MFKRSIIGLLALTAVPMTALAQPVEQIDLRGEAAPTARGQPYAARNLPDRIVLTPGADPTTSMAVSWRTDIAGKESIAEIAELKPAPNFGLLATQIVGNHVSTISENGAALYHEVRFSGLKPGTAYGYRLKGAAGFSEWHQFRTAKASDAPFRMIYMGDTQNNILEIGSLAWRRALVQAGDPQLMLHAGDLVASRDDMVHDDEWGEWTALGGWAIATIPQVPAAGNHEYVDHILPDGSEGRKLGGHWSAMFALPDNGAPTTKKTTYYLDYQGVRIIVMDGTSAIEDGTLDSQTAWLDARLAEAQGNWKIVLFHQPVFTCARPNDTPELKAAWKPLFERHGVDLVLQGHDHCYGRWTAEDGSEAGREARSGGAFQGPVYMVSVAGAKMYGLNDRADWHPDRMAEDTSLFQILDISPDRLALRAHLSTGVLYDGFDLVKQPGGNMLEELAEDVPTVRRCNGPAQMIDGPMPPDRLGPDGLPCTANAKD
ncbi:metallophosphoesterase [Parasphingorhabdus sp.]|uniref:metallophosphoesterase n=1 Tax=Parasphingorhabdus sp. TaxID=2709688 RepID=UPI003593FD4A